MGSLIRARIPTPRASPGSVAVETLFSSEMPFAVTSLVYALRMEWKLCSYTRMLMVYQNALSATDDLRHETVSA